VKLNVGTRFKLIALLVGIVLVAAPVLVACSTQAAPKVPLLLQTSPNLYGELWPEIDFDTVVALAKAAIPGGKFEYFDDHRNLIDPAVNYSDTARGLYHFIVTRPGRADPSLTARIRLVYAPLGDKKVLARVECVDPDAARGEVTAIIQMCFSLPFADSHSAYLEKVFRGLADRAPETFVQVRFGNQSWGLEWFSKYSSDAGASGASVGVRATAATAAPGPLLPESTAVVISAGGR